MHKRHHLLIPVFLLAIVSLIAPWGNGALAQRDNDDDELETYTNRTFDYAISWDASLWDEMDTDDKDVLGLENGSTFVQFIPTEFTGDIEDLYDAFTDPDLMEDDTISNWEPAEDEDGEPLAGSRRSTYYGVFTFTMDGTSKSDPHYAYVQIQPLIEDESAIITFAVSLDETSYNDDIDPVKDVIDTLDVDAEETPEPDEDDGGEDDGDEDETPEPTTDPDDVPEPDDDLWI